MWRQPAECCSTAGSTTPSLPARRGPPNKKPGPEGETRWPDLMNRVGWLIGAGIIPAEKRSR